MRKIVALLILCIFCALGMVQAQSKYMNVPDTVCMSTSSSTADQAKFTSINAIMTGGNKYTYPADANWVIITPSGSAADYNILYSANTSPVKATKLTNTKSLTLEFLVPGTYTFKAALPYKINNGTTQYDTVTKKLVAVNCTINTCNGGYAVMAGFNEDFGTTTVRRAYPVDSVVFYPYQATGILADEYYAISNTTSLRGEWINLKDHTGNTNGAMMVVNSAALPQRFYQKKVTGLCSGSVYNFSAWALNLNTQSTFESGCVSDYKYAGVTFQVVNAANTNQVLANFRTYAISMKLPDTSAKWLRYGGQFTIPSGVADVLVRIVNNKPGGCGNDIAIDDINFTYCSPIITAGLVGNNTNLKEVLCEGTPDTLSSSILPVGYFTKPVYQWEMSDNGGISWFNVPYGTARDSLLKIPAGSLKGTKTVAADYLFRVRVYDKGIPDSLGCANPSSPVKITILPMPILSLTKSQVCVGDAVDLEASGGFDTFSWKDLPGYTGATRSVTLTMDTTIWVYGYVYYGEGGGRTCIDSNSAVIKTDIKPVVDVTPDTVSICLGEVVDYKINKSLAGKDIRWYRGSHGSAIDTTLMPEWNGATDIEVQPGSLADSIYSVMVRSGTCSVQSLPLKVIITQTPPKIKFPAIINCSSANPTGVFNLPDSTQTGVIGSWSIVSYTGIDLQAGETINDYVKIYNPAKINTKVSMPYGSTVVIGWTAQPTANGTCKITSTDTLSLVNNPTFSDAGPDQTQCATSNVFTMAASAPDLTLTGLAAESGKWTLVSGVATIADVTSPTTTVTVAGIQDVVLTWAITNAAGCSGNVGTVTLHKTAPPSAVLKAPLTICSSAGTFNVDSVSTTGAPTNYVLKAGTPALPGFVTMTDALVWPITVTYPTGTLPAPNTYNFILTVSTANPGCTTDIPFSLNVSSPPTAPTGVTVGTPSICDTGSTILTVVGGDLGKKANGSADAKWKWYAGACGGTAIDSGASIAVHGISATTTYYVRAEGTCGNTACASGTVTVYTKPAAAAAGVDQLHCSDSLFTMAANTPTAGTGAWTIVSGTATITTPASPTSTVFVLAGNTATLRWTITNGVCTSNDDVVLTNYKKIQAAAGADQNHCATPAFTMAANTPATGSGAWTLVSGAATITTPASATSAVTVANGATATLRWTITNGTCTTTDDVVLTNYATPTTSVAGPAQTHCSDSLFTMAANTPTVGTGAWTIVSGTATITTPASPTTTVFVLAGNTATLQWTISNGTCTASSTTLVLTNNKNIQAAAGADQNHCATPAFTMAANTPATGSGAWTLVSGAATITTPASATSAVTVANGATATLRWTITNGTCTTTDDVVLTNYATPTTSVAGPAQSHCSDSLFTMAANTPTVGTGVWTIVSGTATITTPTSPTSTVFVLAGKTATLQWTISNGTCTASSTTVVLTNSAAPTPITPAPDQTHCSDSLFTMAATPASLGAGVWTILSGTATITTPASPTSTVFVLAGNTATLRWTITNGACVLTDDIVLTNYKKIQAAAGADQNHCATPAFTMAANTPATGSGAWTLVSGAATITTPASATSAVTVANGATATLRWTITNGTCTTTDDVVLTNYATPTTSVAGPAQSHCSDSLFTMAANAPTVGTGVWTIVSGTATITTPTSPTSTVFVLAGNTATLQWTISNGTCTASSTTVVLTNSKNIQAAAGADQTHCATPAFTMAANTPATGSGLWTLVSGVATITTPASATSAVTVASGATATLRWTITNGTCTTTDDVVLTNYATPTTSVAGPAQSHCSDSLFTMAANTPTVGTGLWTIVSGTATITTPSSPTSTVFVLAGKTATLQWTISNGTCTASSSTVVLTNYMKPANAAAGPDLSHCSDSLFTMVANKATFGAGVWTIVSGAGTNITTPSSEVTTIFVKAGNTATLRWTITNGVCTSNDDIVLTNYMSIPAVAGADQNHCATPAFTMAANTPGTGTGTWTLVSGAATITTPASATSAVTVATGATATLRWTITNGTCTTTDDVVLTNYATPTTSVAGPAQSHCSDSLFTMAANAPTVGTGLWTIVSGTATITTPTSPTTTVFVLSGKTATLQWTISNGTCTASSTTVVLTNNAAPTPITPAPDQTHCSDSLFTMAATPASVGAGVWTILSGTATITTPASPTSTVFVLAGNTATLRWTITNGTCVLTDDVVLTNNMKIQAAAGADQDHCATPAFTMTANTPATGTGVWTIVSGAATITTPASATSAVTVANGTTATLRWTITNGTCTTTDDVVLTNYDIPTTSVAGPAQTHCNDSLFTMAANTPTVGTGVWTIVSGTATITTPASPTTTVFVLAGNTATLQWTISNGTCTPSSSTVVLTNNKNIQAAAGPDQTHCATPAFTLAANDAGTGTGAWTIVKGTATITSPTSPTSAVTVANGDSAYLVWTITDGSCASTSTVILMNYAAPTTSVAGPAQSHCSDSLFTMAANTPTVGTGAWTVISGTATITTPTSPTSTVFVLAGKTATLQWTISNGTCTPSTSTIVLNNYQNIQAVAGLDQAHCASPAFTLAANSAGTGTGVWTIVSGTATITSPTSPTSAVTVANGDSAYLVWTITNGTCTTTSQVILRNYANPSTSVAGSAQSHCSDSLFTMAANTPTVGTGVWTIVSGTATITTPTSPTSTVFVLAGKTATLQWTISNGTCPPSSSTVVLTNYMKPANAAAGPDLSHCSDSLFTMVANKATFGAGVWTIVSGTATITTPSSEVTTIFVKAGNTATLRWTITNGVCTTSDDIILSNAMNIPAVAGPDQSHCVDPNFTMAANTPGIGTGVWTILKGTATITTPTSPTSAVTVATGDSAYLVWTITNGSCTSTDTVILRNAQKAVDADAGTAQEHCGDPIFILAGNTPDLPSAIGTWTVLSPASVTIAAADIHKTNATVNVPAGVTATLTWTISNLTCSTSSNVTLTNFGPILGNTITADQTLCATETPATLTGGAVSGGKGTYTYQWVMSTDSINYTAIASATNNTYSSGVIAATTWFKRVVTSGACAPDTSNAVKLSLITKPPVVVTVPAAITTDCIQGKDYTTLFGTPTFSHEPYSKEVLTVTSADLTTVVDACTTTIRRTWTATDRCGLNTSAQQTITVVDRTAPVFTTAAPANVTVNCDAVPAAVNLTAKDDCAGMLTVVPIEVRQDIVGACTSNYLLIRKWVIADACGNVSDTLRQTVTVKDLTPPVFTMIQPANITVDCDKVPAKTDLTATDNCTPGVITVTPTDSLATITGSTCTQNYRIIRKWIATDNCGNTTILRQTITVQDTSRPVFSIPQPANITVDCDKVPALPTVTATDNCTAVVTVTVGQKKEFLSTTCSNNYKLTRTWTAKDDCGNTTIMSQVIVVQDTTRPTFTVVPPADTTISCDAIPAPATNLKAIDNCSATSNVKIAYTQTRQNITGACASNYQLIRTWTARDECGNSTVIRQVITVVDTTKPVIDPAPANITVNCGESIQIAATLYARDNCDGTFPKKATMKEDPYVKDICNGYTIIRRWTIADACGNQAIERVQTITVNPCPKPELDPTLPVNCSNNTKFAILLKNKVSKPKFTLVSITPATAVTTPLTQTSNVFDLKGATQATFTVTDGVTGCVSDPVTYDLQYTAKPVVNLGNDTSICSGNTLTLDAGAANAAYTIR
ncbi:hypothetical protein SAMN05428988_6599, partial [Chitinophaga sp. YR573]|uniref:HYR-like domain-containing protein n=1 Tax=Chitinophaga sp. YR573 TaxID=1881040 RepID=UPI0008BAC8B1